MHSGSRQKIDEDRLWEELGSANRVLRRLWPDRASSVTRIRSSNAPLARRLSSKSRLVLEARRLAARLASSPLPILVAGAIGMRIPGIAITRYGASRSERSGTFLLGSGWVVAGSSCRVVREG